MRDASGSEMDDFTLSSPSPDEGEEILVGPIEAESAADVLARIERRDREREDFAGTDEGESLEPDYPTFTLWQMLIVVTVLCVWLGVLRALSMLRMPILSGLTGIAALIAMFWISSQEDQPKILRVMWWGMLILYITCAIATSIFG
jgi:hypothetical protein